MDTGKMKSYARLGETSQKACAERLRASFHITGLNQKELAEAIGKWPTSINNQLHGRQYPSRDLATFLYERYRIDFNFLFAGQFAQLPGDVQDALYLAFEELNTDNINNL